VRAREEKKAAAQSNGNARREPKRREKPKPAISKDRKRRMAAVEGDIQSAESALAKLEDELSDPAAWSTPERSAKSAKRHEEAKRAVEGLYEELAALEGG
jgi:ATP-binding cassette subfamily F protein 3